MNTRKKWMLALAFVASSAFASLANASDYCYAECAFGTGFITCDYPQFSYCDCSFGFPYTECRGVY